MPARTRRIAIDDNTRAKIQTTQLVNRLQKHIDGEVKLDASQVRGIEILLKKTLPDLQATHESSAGTKSFEDWLDELTGTEQTEG